MSADKEGKGEDGKTDEVGAEEVGARYGLVPPRNRSPVTHLPIREEVQAPSPYLQ